MKEFEILHQGRRVALVGLEDGISTVTFTIRNQVDPILLDARGRDRSSGGHAKWVHQFLSVGDEFIVKLVDTAPE